MCSYLLYHQMWVLEPACSQSNLWLSTARLFFSCCRGLGDEFRAWYGKISQLRSLLPSNTPVVALTGTATHYVKDRIVHALQMAPVQMITKPANRPNLRYSVQIVKRDVHVTFKWLISDLKRKRTTLPKVIVFCRSIHTCAALYK